MSPGHRFRRGDITRLIKRDGLLDIPGDVDLHVRAYYSHIPKQCDVAFCSPLHGNETVVRSIPADLLLPPRRLRRKKKPRRRRTRRGPYRRRREVV